MAEVDSSELEDALGEFANQQAKELANAWFSRSQDLLVERGDDVGYDYYPILQSGVAPQETGGGWMFQYTHRATGFFEWGTEPHEITPTNAEYLAFEWEDAPQEVKEMFPETFPTVFFKKVEVDGVKEHRFIRDSRDQTLRSFRA